MGLDLPVINASLRRFHFLGIRLMAFFRNNSVMVVHHMAVKGKQMLCIFLNSILPINFDAKTIGVNILIYNT